MVDNQLPKESAGVHVYIQRKSLGAILVTSSLVVIFVPNSLHGCVATCNVSNTETWLEITFLCQAHPKNLHSHAVVLFSSFYLLGTRQASLLPLGPNITGSYSDAIQREPTVHYSDSLLRAQTIPNSMIYFFVRRFPAPHMFFYCFIVFGLTDLSMTCKQKKT